MANLCVAGGVANLCVAVGVANCCVAGRVANLCVAGGVVNLCVAVGVANLCVAGGMAIPCFYRCLRCLFLSVVSCVPLGVWFLFSYHWFCAAENSSPFSPSFWCTESRFFVVHLFRVLLHLVSGFGGFFPRGTSPFQFVPHRKHRVVFPVLRPALLLIEQAAKYF